LQALLSKIEVPRHTRQIGITIDSQATAYPRRTLGKPLYGACRRLHQAKQRLEDERRNNHYSMMLKEVLVRGRHSWKVPWRISFARSHEDPLLQVADVLVNFVRRYAKLGLVHPPHRADFGPGHQKWASGYALLQHRTWWIHNPVPQNPLLLARRDGHT